MVGVGWVVFDRLFVAFVVGGVGAGCAGGEEVACVVVALRTLSLEERGEGVGGRGAAYSLGDGGGAGDRKQRGRSQLNGLPWPWLRTVCSF